MAKETAPLQYSNKLRLDRGEKNDKVTITQLLGGIAIGVMAHGKGLELQPTDLSQPQSVLPELNPYISLQKEGKGKLVEKAIECRNNPHFLTVLTTGDTEKAKYYRENKAELEELIRNLDGNIQALKKHIPIEKLESLQLKEDEIPKVLESIAIALIGAARSGIIYDSGSKSDVIQNKASDHSQPTTPKSEVIVPTVEIVSPQYEIYFPDEFKPEKRTVSIQTVLTDGPYPVCICYFFSPKNRDVEVYPLIKVTPQNESPYWQINTIKSLGRMKGYRILPRDNEKTIALMAGAVADAIAKTNDNKEEKQTFEIDFAKTALTQAIKALCSQGSFVTEGQIIETR